MATDNNRTKTPNDAVKITELPEGSQLLLVDKSGTVLERMEAERFMELLRASIQIGGRNLLLNTNKGATNWFVNTAYPKVCEEYVWPDGTRGAHLVISDNGTIPASGTYKTILYNLGDAVLRRLEPDTDYVLSLEIESVSKVNLAARICSSTSKNGLSDSSESQSLTAGEHRRLYFRLHTTDFSPEDIIDQSIYFNLSGFCEFRIRDLKLERGNTPTDWTPAPEDLGFGGGNLLANRLLQICTISPESANAFKNNSNR